MDEKKEFIRIVYVNILLIFVPLFITMSLLIFLPFSPGTALIIGISPFWIVIPLILLIKEPFIIIFKEDKLILRNLLRSSEIDLKDIVWIFWNNVRKNTTLERFVAWFLGCWWFDGSPLGPTYKAIGKGREGIFIVLFKDKKIHFTPFPTKKMFDFLANHCKNAVVGYNEKYEEKVYKYSYVEWVKFCKSEREKLNLPII